MSRRHLLILVALTSALTVCAGPRQSPANNLRDLLIKDDIQQAEAVLLRTPRSAESLAFQGEVDFRKGNFEKARTSYQAAMQMNEKTARAHFGLGKLALAKVNSKTALTEFRRAIALDPMEPLYHFLASEAADLEKSTAESRKHLEEFVRLDRHDDEDRLTEAKAGIGFDGGVRKQGLWRHEGSGPAGADSLAKGAEPDFRGCEDQRERPV